MKSAFGNTAARSGSDIIVVRVASLIIAAAAIFLFSLAFSKNASADYVCQCVNGELAAIVSGNIDVQPVCAPRVCPAPSSTSSMARSLQVSSKGGSGSDCAPQQVMNTATGQYEWKVLCK